MTRLQIVHASSFLKDLGTSQDVRTAYLVCRPGSSSRLLDHSSGLRNDSETRVTCLAKPDDRHRSEETQAKVRLLFLYNHDNLAEIWSRPHQSGVPSQQ